MDLDNMLPDVQKAPPPEPEWSEYQNKIFNVVETTTDNISIEAVAGSGKTSTIVKACTLLPKFSDNLFLAFNKSIVKELSARLPYSVSCKTLNALGHGLLMRKLRGSGKSPKLNGYRIYDHTRSVLSELEYEEYGPAMVRMVSLARSNAVGIIQENTAQTFLSFMGDYDVDIPMEYEQRAARQASEILRRLIATVEEEFDFDDQLYMPVFYEQSFPSYDTVFVDEAQDLSPIQHLMLERLEARGARIIAVGDSRQAIYGFRGADTASMTRLANRFNMTLLPLSISYRCPKAVVREAQQIVYHIQAHENAPEGSVSHLAEFPEPKDFDSAGMVISRTNAPIFRLALTFLEARVPCHIMTNFGKDLVNFVRNFNTKTTEELQEELQKWHDKEKQKAENRKWYGKAQQITDRYEALAPFCESFEFTVQVISALQQLLTTEAGTKISTIHKAKGLEADSVYILRPDLLPAPFAKTEAQVAQEHNLKYVAVTRAKLDLYFLPMEQDS